MATISRETEQRPRKLTSQPAHADIRYAIESAQAYLRSIQHEAGYWCGELEGDSILESEYVLTLYFLGRESDPRLRKAANYLRRLALPDGGWAIYPGGPAEVSSSIKAYFALKLAGEDPKSPLMRRAAAKIRALGGLRAANSFTCIYLAIFGQYPWELCPAVLPEMILLPSWAPFNIYEMSAWSRGIVVPLSIIWALRPRCDVPESAGISELWEDAAEPAKKAEDPASSVWREFFGAVDDLLKYVERRHRLPSRKRALKRCERWMLQHFEKSDGIGAIFPPIVNSIFALRALAYPLDHPVLVSQVQELEKLAIEKGQTLRVQPCTSPVWDTALAMTAMAESGVRADDPALLKAAQWILKKEVRERGDWAVKNPEGKPGGWYFEFANEFYPDIDDTFQVLTALSKTRFADAETEKKKREAMDRGIAWNMSMQNKDGGWASFDRACDKHFLARMPFADHNAMIDPSTADITARALVTLKTLGYPSDHPAVERAVEFLRQQREPDGSWYGRWGCNFIYGTFLALYGLSEAGAPIGQMEKSVEWLRSVQNPDGGWGELPESYRDLAFKGKGPSTPSQTAWALMGIIAAGGPHDAAVGRGIAYLLKHQQDDGSWQEDFWTGTGFPEVFYLHYHLYATYFPLMALGMFARRVSEGD